jgi:hypothetical protein
MRNAPLLDGALGKATVLENVTQSVPPCPGTTGAPLCDAAGAFCGVLGFLEREAAGRARLCCRHYLHDEVVV